MDEKLLLSIYNIRFKVLVHNIELLSYLPFASMTITCIIFPFDNKVGVFIKMSSISISVTDEFVYFDYY